MKSEFLLTCEMCKTDCYEDYITIEKCRPTEDYIFLDICRSCFEVAADQILKICTFSLHEDPFCIYCKDPQKFSIHDNEYCAVYYSPRNYVFMHTECYNKHIGL